MNRFDSWVFTEYQTSARNLAVYRILFAGLMLLTAVPRAWWLDDVPAAFFNPPVSLAAMVTGFPPYAMIVALNLLLVLSLVLLLLGWHTRAASIATTMIFLFLGTWEFSLGKINHGILVAIAPMVLAYSGWGNALSIDARRKKETDVIDTPNFKGSWCVTLMAFVIGLAMFTGGWVKLRTGWLDWGILATRGYLASNFYGVGRHTVLGEWLLRTDAAILWKPMDWGVVMLECGFLLAPLRRNLFRAFCAVACLFHFSTWLMFDIRFIVNVIAYGVVVDWVSFPGADTLRSAYRAAGNGLGRCPPGLLLLALLIPFSGLALFGQQPLVSLLPIPIIPMILTAGAAVGAGYLLSLVRTRRAWMRSGN